MSYELKLADECSFTCAVGLPYEHLQSDHWSIVELSIYMDWQRLSRFSERGVFQSYMEILPGLNLGLPKCKPGALPMSNDPFLPPPPHRLINHKQELDKLWTFAKLQNTVKTHA